MNITLTSPGALWLLAIIPLVWAARFIGRTNFNRRQQVLQAGVRSLLLAALALALARPVVSFGSSKLSIVYLVDVSHSIASRSISEAAGRIEALNADVRPSDSKIVAFGRDTAVLKDLADLRRFADSALPDTALGIDRTGSDLERAISAARAEVVPGHLPRIVLFSDGRETTGDVHRIVTRLAAEGVPVFVETLGVRDLGDAWVDGIDLPVHLPAGALVKATVRVGSQRPSVASVALRDGARVLASKQVPVDAGTTSVPLDVTFDREGAHALEATIDAPGDPLVANNRLSREALVEPRTRVLYVEGAADSAQYLQGALQESGFDVTVARPAAMPVTSDGLEPWDVAIVSDVARSSMPEASMSALADWVEQDGGGLLVAGGDAVYGEAENEPKPGGYRHTELERITPVTFERKDKPEIALIIVLDKSWSMAGQVMELCKAAAQAAIDVLSDEQQVGLITFNDGLNWEFSLRNVGKNRDAIRKIVSAIEPSGHTLIYPAVEQAFIGLKDARARAKHVVLLSDGRSYPDDYEGLVKKMVAAKITVSSIAVGPAADAELLGNIAKWGKGRSYVVQDAKEVPQIFVKEAKDAATPAFDEGKTIKPVVKARGFLDGVDFTRMPGLRGRTATVLKDNAMLLLATEDDDPLLSFWPIGAGRTAVFASDVKDRWAADWVKWRGYGPFFTSVVRAIERQRPRPFTLDVTTRNVDGGARTLAIAVEARDAHGAYRDLLKPTVRVESADGKNVELPARQVAPGRYETSVVADATQALAVSLAGSDGSVVASRLVLPDSQAEYRFRPADAGLLDGIARATGGTMHAVAADLSRTGGAHQTARRAMWPGLVLAALGLWLLDILMRRVRVLEPA